MPFAYPDRRVHTIRIAHEQCELISRLLRFAMDNDASISSDDYDEATLLALMFEDLPVENDADTMTHGFCL